VSGLRVLKKGNAAGPFLGGCLSLVASLVGTPHLPDLQGAVLFLEDVNEEPYRLDRMLNQLRLAGVFDTISGLVLGDFHGCEPERPSDGSAEEVFAALAEDIPCPVCTGLPYGHTCERRVFPMGVKVEIDSASGQLHFDVSEA
jgi:muramoyltetrapeptide carboxypeptidase